MKKIILFVLLLMCITTNAQTIVSRLEFPSWNWGLGIGSSKRNLLLVKLNNQQVFTIFADKYNTSYLDQLKVGTKVSVKENWFDWELKADGTKVSAESYKTHRGRESKYDEWRFCQKATIQDVVVDKENQNVYIGVSGNWYECPMKVFDYRDMWILFLRRGTTVGFATFMKIGIYDYSLRLCDVYNINKSSLLVYQVSPDYVKNYIKNKDKDAF